MAARPRGSILRPMRWVEVASLAELPAERGFAIEVGAEEIALWRVGERVYAMSNVCPHAGLPLADGRRRDCIVYCAGHGWDFDLRTGLPAGQTRGRALPTYPVRVQDERVWIGLGD